MRIKIIEKLPKLKFIAGENLNTYNKWKLDNKKFLAKNYKKKGPKHRQFLSKCSKAISETHKFLEWKVIQTEKNFLYLDEVVCETPVVYNNKTLTLIEFIGRFRDSSEVLSFLKKLPLTTEKTIEVFNYFTKKGIVIWTS